MGLFSFLKNRKKAKPASPESGQLTEEYRRAVFLDACSNPSPLRSDLDYPRFLVQECAISSPSSYQKDLQAEGFFEPCDLAGMLRAMNIVDLHRILTDASLAPAPDRDGCIALILSSAADQAKLLHPETWYRLSEKSRLYLQSHQDLLQLHRHRNDWMISPQEYEKKKDPALSFMENIEGILTSRMQNAADGMPLGSAAGREQHLYGLYLLYEENGRRDKALNCLLEILQLCLGSEISPEIISALIDHQDLYDPSLLLPLPESPVCGKEQLDRILQGIFDQTIDEDSIPELLSQD